MDVEGKLYGQVLLCHLNEELQCTGELAEQQYEYRKGRQTVDANNEVLGIAREAEGYHHTNRKLCAIITLDIKNAFNCDSWQLIFDELRREQGNI